MTVTVGRVLTTDARAVGEKHMLDASGVDEDIYFLLTDNPNSSVESLTERVNRPVDEVRAALDRLTAIRLVLSADGGDTWETVAVKPIPSRLPAGSDIERTSTMGRRERAHGTATALPPADHPARTRGYELVERVRGRTATWERCARLAASARSELLTVVPDHLPHQGVFGVGSWHGIALAAGARLRSIHRDGLSAAPETVRHIRWLRESGGSVRTIPSVPRLLVISDRKSAIIPADPRDSRSGALVTHNPGIVAALCTLFENLWATGAPPHHEGTQPSPREQELIRLLSDGCTDATAARTLGISLRTVRRISAQLMSRLNTRSRFEAGVLAERRGWLSDGRTRYPHPMTGRSADRIDRAGK